MAPRPTHARAALTSAAISFDGERSSIAVATGFGPRIVGLFVNDRNLLVELPDDDTLEGPDGRLYWLRGGHRLWVAPEIREVTYQPDDEPCAVSRTGDGIRVEGPPDGAGFSKAITVTGIGEGWRVDHTLTNQGPAAVRAAPWAITQFRPGGLVTLRFAGEGDGLQADRALVLWPYTDPTDARLSIGAAAVEVDAVNGPPMKVGVAGHGYASYEIERVRIDIRVTVDPLAIYSDLGAAVQASICDRFCAVETLGPLTVLPPGSSVTHREEWTISGAS